jgi:membrane protease subunit HflC
MRTALLLIVGIVLVGLAATCVFVVDETAFAVQLRFGHPVRSIIQPGLYGKYPWPVDTLVRFDNRLMVLENPGPDEPDREYLTQDEQSGIGKNVVVTTYACWRIKRNETAVLRFLESMGDQASAEARLGDVIVAELGATLGRHDFSVLVSDDPERRRWSAFLESIRAACSERVEEAYGIEIVDVRIQRLNFPRQNRRNVFERMRAERETIAARYRSEGEERATAIRATAERQREEILAKAFEEAEQIRGRADAEAARIYADAYGQDPDFYDFLRTLEAYEKTLNEGTVAILAGDSDFLRLLNRPAAKAPPAVEKPTPVAPAPETGTVEGE